MLQRCNTRGPPRELDLLLSVDSLQQWSLLLEAFRFWPLAEGRSRSDVGTAAAPVVVDSIAIEGSGCSHLTSEHAWPLE